MENDLLDYIPKIEGKTHVIYNPLDIDSIKKLAKEIIDHPWFKQEAAPVLICVGRLVEQKGQDILIQALSEIKEILNVHVIFIGEGDQLSNLRKLAAKLNLSDKIDFINFVDNPYKYIAKSDVLLMPSRSGMC